MNKIFGCILTLQVLSLSLGVYGFDMKLDEQKDSKFWRITGNYVYASSLVDGGRLAPKLKSVNGSAPTKGVWYFKHTPLRDDNDNYFEISYSLTHSLMKQVWVRLLAHPSVPVNLEGPSNEPLGSFYSTGAAWCDVVLSNKLLRSFKLSVNLTLPGTYAMVDKIVLGIQSDITPSVLDPSKLNPCLGIGNSVNNSAVHENYEDLLVVETTTPPPRTSNTLQKERNLFGFDEDESSLMRAARDIIIPTDTSTTSSIDGARCSCSCTCSKPGSSSSDSD